METVGEHRIRSDERTVARWAAALFATVASLTVVLSTSGVGSAGTSLPPFAGTTWSGNNLISTACRSIVKWTTMPHWSTSKGAGGASAKISAGSCPISAGGNSGGVIQTDLTVAIPVTLPGGSHTLSVNVTAHFTGGQNARVGGPCPAPALSSGGSGYRDCSVYSQYSFQENNAQLWDATINGMWGSSPPGPNFYNYTWDYHDTSCSSGAAPTRTTPRSSAPSTARRSTPRGTTAGARRSRRPARTTSCSPSTSRRTRR